MHLCRGQLGPPSCLRICAWPGMQVVNMQSWSSSAQSQGYSTLWEMKVMSYILMTSTITCSHLSSVTPGTTAGRWSFVANAQVSQHSHLILVYLFCSRLALQHHLGVKERADNEYPTVPWSLVDVCEFEDEYSQVFIDSHSGSRSTCSAASTMSSSIRFDTSPDPSLWPPLS
jgi:hypothetical protein